MSLLIQRDGRGFAALTLNSISFLRHKVILMRYRIAHDSEFWPRMPTPRRLSADEIGMSGVVVQACQGLEPINEAGGDILYRCGCAVDKGLKVDARRCVEMNVDVLGATHFHGQLVGVDEHLGGNTPPV